MLFIGYSSKSSFHLVMFKIHFFVFAVTICIIESTMNKRLCLHWVGVSLQSIIPLLNTLPLLNSGFYDNLFRNARLEMEIHSIPGSVYSKFKDHFVRCTVKIDVPLLKANGLSLPK